MSVLDDFGDMMTQSVVYTPIVPDGRNVDGKPTFGTPVTYPCRIEAKSLRTANQFSGQDWVGAGVIYVGAFIETINQDDKWELPNGTPLKVINHYPVYDENGGHHTKLIFGGTQFGGNR